MRIAPTRFSQELRSLLAKTAGVFSLLGKALAVVAENVEFAFVYGSFAKGEERPESDIDLMVIGEITLDQLLEHLVPVERELKRPINPTVYARAEVRKKLRSNNHFLKAIQNAPLHFLIGDENEFREIR
ncbi:nucleotidyltransferase domain-containing protein [Terriglobus sp. RCC_193]|uniref:nucleotidyltransferase domain-containing protein n=1 Tax=Terriglobus sp. RCC_193 TaxID=3239218 RepID=UPI0035250361